MDWFERLTGFRETGYADTRAKLAIEGRQLVSRVNGQRYGIGNLELVSLQTLRDRVQAGSATPGALSVRTIRGSVRALHANPEFSGALFQVASQFNLLEMVGPDVTPEQGVTRYQHDRTQGPACAMAAGAATMYRNYFAPVAGEVGQTRDRQLDGLAGMGAALGSALGMPVSAPWTMRTCFTLGAQAGLTPTGKHSRGPGGGGRDALRAGVCISLHGDVEVADGDDLPRQGNLAHRCEEAARTDAQSQNTKAVLWPLTHEFRPLVRDSGDCRAGSRAWSGRAQWQSFNGGIADRPAQTCAQGSGRPCPGHARTRTLSAWRCHPLAWRSGTRHFTVVVGRTHASRHELAAQHYKLRS